MVFPDLEKVDGRCATAFVSCVWKMTCEVTNLEWRRQLGRKSESVSAEAEEEDPVAGSHPEDLR